MQKLLPVLIASAFVVACGSSQQQQAEEAAKKMEQGAQQMQKAAEQMAKDAQGSSAQMAAGLQQMAQGFQQMAQGTAKPVDFEQLKNALPEVSGWTRTTPRGEQTNMPVAISRAEARYTKDNSRVELEIVDTALSQLLLAPVSMFLGSGYSERSDDGFKRSAKVGGQPGFEEWNSDDKRGEVTAVVANRFIVKGTGHQVENLDTVRSVVEAVDLGKLGSLK
jgi:X-X-X-Leu-X-X-Gly heptad repeat protein